MQYQRVSRDVVEELRSIVGKGNVIFDDEEKLEGYAHDEVQGLKSMPEVVVKPQGAEEISKILKLANKNLIPITPRGGGSGLSGGAVPILGGIVISFERMNRILEIDEDNMVVVVEPGVITNDINRVLKERNLYYPGYPMSVESCFIGGNVAENAGGGKAIKYGVTGRYVLGLDVVLPTGEIAHFGGKRVKDVTGYDMVHLFVGSEGTLGIFTKIILKIIPLPGKIVDLFVPFSSVTDAINTVSKVMSIAGITPTAVEYMDRLSVRTAVKYLGGRFPIPDAEAYLLIEIDDRNKAQLEEDYEKIGNLCMENGALDVFIADNNSNSERMWKVRRNIGEAFDRFEPIQQGEDIVVPRKEIPKIVEELQRLSEEFDVLIPTFGHAGDGNLHPTIIKPKNMDMEEWERLLQKLLTKLYKKVKELGGTLSGEHGIGYKRKKYLPIFLSQDEIKLMKRIKLAFDPNLILNPGKIFDIDMV